MAGPDTWMGGDRSDFPSTHWTLLLRLRDPSHPQYLFHLNQLVNEYWKPCYFYIRRCWHMSVEDAKDLTQEFFARLLDKDYLSTMSPERGSFRGYLRTALFHFMGKAKRHDRVRRPRDGAQLIHFQADEDWARAEPVSEEHSPEETFDRAWSELVLRDSVNELKSMLGSMGKEVYAKVFDRYYGLSSGAPAASPTYSQVAEELNLKETDVRNYLTFVRTLLRKIVVARVRTYVSNDDELEAEVSAILGE